jgi:phenylacetate-CoA ligase
MSSIERVHEYMVGRGTFPFFNYLFNRKNILGMFHEMKKSEWFPQELLQEMQLKKLIKLIKYSYAHIPYYKKIFCQIGLLPGDIKTLDDIKMIPPLSRQDVIDCHRDMVDERLLSSIKTAEDQQGAPGEPKPFARFRRNRLVRNTSSGSTGAPTVFYDDGSRSAVNWACELRLKNWFGIEPGGREARLVKLSTDYAPNNKAFLLRKLLWGQLVLPGINLSADDYRFCLNEILNFKPKVLWGFTGALTGLGEFILDQGDCLGAYRPRMVNGWAGPVYDHERDILNKAFGCFATNIYGSREVGHIAATCPQGTFHINQENLLLESIQTEEITETEKNLGEILVTTLDVTPMPFIRYRMGDIGNVALSRCSCGRTLQVLENLLGRTGEIFITKNGRMISPNFWCRTFMSGQISGAVRRFQVIYTKRKDLKIKIEKDTGYSSETEHYIRETVIKNFSTDTELTIEYLTKIEAQISGKYQMVVNEARMQ